MSSRKTLAATLTTTLDDQAATLRLHTCTETMSLLAPMIVRLICLLHPEHLLILYCWYKAGRCPPPET